MVFSCRKDMLLLLSARRDMMKKRKARKNKVNPSDACVVYESTKTINQPIGGKKPNAWRLKKGRHPIPHNKLPFFDAVLPSQTHSFFYSVNMIFFYKYVHFNFSIKFFWFFFYHKLRVVSRLLLWARGKFSTSFFFQQKIKIKRT